MFEEMRDLYQEVILEHGKHPRNCRHLERCTQEAMGKNPACGDALVVYLKIDPEGIVQDCSFLGQGCAISMASASMMTEIVRGKSQEAAARVFRAFHALATGDGEPDLTGLNEDDVERLQVLAGVREYPVRVKCATLAWHTMSAAMQGDEATSTE